MNQLPKPNRLFVFLSLSLLTLVTICGLSGCGPGGQKDSGLPPADDEIVKKHTIPIDTAIQYTASFRAAIDSFNRNCPTFKDSMQFGHAEAWPTDVFVKLLTEQNEKQGKAKGIRVYFGRGVHGEIKLVLVPYDKNGNDMIDHLVELGPDKSLKSNGQAVEDGQRCPTACDDGGSGLN